MIKGQGIYYFVGIFSLVGCVLVTYGMVCAFINKTDPLTFIGLLIANASLALSAAGSITDIANKEKDRIELEAMKDSIETLATTLERIEKKIEDGNMEINTDIKNVLRTINEQECKKSNFSLFNYSLLSLNNKEDLKRK